MQFELTLDRTHESKVAYSSLVSFKAQGESLDARSEEHCANEWTYNVQTRVLSADEEVSALTHLRVVSGHCFVASVRVQTTAVVTLNKIVGLLCFRVRGATI